MVLAAGLGQRLRPLTQVRAKPVLPLLNRPLLHWTLQSLARQGVDEVVVNVHHLPATVKKALGDGRTLGLTIRYSPEMEILGTGGGLKHARRWLGEGPLLVVNGDVLFDFDVRALVRDHVGSHAQATLAVRANPDPTHYSGLSVERSWITGIVQPPAPPRSLMFTGVHVVETSLLDRLPDGPSDSVRDLYVPLILEGGSVRAFRTKGTWYDFGDPSLYLESQMSLLQSGFRSFRPRRRLVDPKALVAKGASVVDSVVGPGCVIEAGARVARSVLWENVRVAQGAWIEGSIVATGARIAAGAVERGAVIVPTPEGVVRARMAEA
jgi:NDP-sugar pyrophosphorylase family protein